MMFPSALLLVRDEDGTTPEARSPFVSPVPPSRDMFHQNVRVNGSPVSNHHYSKSGNLFVVNPSVTPRESPTPTTIFHGSRGDTKGFTKLKDDDVIVQVTPKDSSEERRGPGVFPAFVAAQVGSHGALAPQAAPSIIVKSNISAPIQLPVTSQKRTLFNWPKPPTKPSIRGLAISQPVPINVDNNSVQPFARMQTIDLATAANNERERREGAAARSRLVANRPAPLPPSIISAQEALRKTVSTKRKEMPLSTHKTEQIPIIGISESGNTTSTSLSPGRDDVRRRSPQRTDAFDPFIEEKVPMKPTTQRKQTIGLPSNPKAQRITMAQEATGTCRSTSNFRKTRLRSLLQISSRGECLRSRRN